MAPPSRILIVDDDPDIRQTLGDRLAADGHEVLTAADGAEGLERIRANDPDVVVLDLQMPQVDGMGVLAQLKREGLVPTVVVVTAYGSIDRAVAAMKAGAYDFVTKPFESDRVQAAVTKALEREQLRRDNAFLREQSADAVPRLLCSSKVMEEVLASARRAADSGATLLLSGESGTGKEVLARTIHTWSPRRDRPFVAVNCVALPRHLLESELFGHERGAFTGADRQQKGRFEIARQGTIFLDEIGATEKDLQLKLLRVLQDGAFERVGGTQALRANVRVVAATNRNLELEMKEGRFLEDLYYRLNVITIHLPPLRGRRDDIPILANYFLRKYTHEAKRDMEGISEAAMRDLQAYDWPGNVRELENAIERAVVLGSDATIQPEDLPPAIAGLASETKAEISAGYHHAVECYKRDVIRRALKEADGNQSRAAESLGLQRTYLSRLMKNLGLR